MILEDCTTRSILTHYLKLEIHDNTTYLYAKSYLTGEWIALGCSVEMLIGEAIELGAMLEKDSKHKHRREQPPWPCNQ